MTLNYFSVFGQSAGPIQVCKEKERRGVWLNTVALTTGSTPHILEVVEGRPDPSTSTSYAIIRAASPSTESKNQNDNDVVTLGFLKQYVGIGGVVTGDYVSTERFNTLYNAVIGMGNVYPTSQPPLHTRLTALEDNYIKIDSNIQSVIITTNQCKKDVETLNAQVAVLNSKINTIVSKPFQEPMILHAGGALWPVEVE